MVTQRKPLMMAVLIGIGFLSSHTLHAQKVFTAEYSGEADVKVFIAEYKSEADLVVYKAEYDDEAKGNSGIWFFTEYSNEAKKKIYFTEYKNEADLVIFYTDSEGEAGWQNKKKESLMD